MNREEVYEVLGQKSKHRQVKVTTYHDGEVTFYVSNETEKYRLEQLDKILWITRRKMQWRDKHPVQASLWVWGFRTPNINWLDDYPGGNEDVQTR